jgi:hypothetical protein
MTDLEERLAELEARLASVESQAGGEPPGLARLMREIFPSEVRTHMRAARREQLLAARAFLDHWIARLEKEPAERLPRRETISLD